MLKKLKNPLVIGLTLLSLASCSTLPRKNTLGEIEKKITPITIASALFPNSTLPRKDALRKIEKKVTPYTLYNCVNASIDYAKVLWDSNIEARVVSGYLSGNHAWVEYKLSEDNEWHMAEPTWKGDSTQIDGLEGFPIRYYSRTNNKWFEYKKEITPEELRNKKGIVKIYWDRITPEVRIRLMKDGYNRFTLDQSQNN